MRRALALLALVCWGCASLPLRVADRPTRAVSAPPALRASGGEVRRVPLVWQPVRSDDVAGYAVERAGPDDAEFARVGVVRGRFTTTWVDTVGLADATRYRYRVRGIAGDGALGETTSPVAAATTAGPPAPPRGLEAISHLPRRVALQWRAAPDPRVVGYVVERSPSADGPFLTVAHPDGRFASAWVDTGLGDLRVFYYRVASRNEAGVVGEPGSAVQAVTKARPLPPIGLRVDEKRLGANELAWEPNVEEDVAGYRLLRRAPGEAEARAVALLPRDTLSAEDPVAAGETVVYTLVAVDADGLESLPSDPVEVQSEGYDLAASATDAGIALRWNARRDEGFAGARVYRVGALRRHELARVDADAFVDADVEAGRTYRYAVVLERPDGTRAPASAVVQAEPRGLSSAPGPR